LQQQQEQEQQQHMLAVRCSSPVELLEHGRHPIVCPMAAAGKCEAQWKYGGHHFFTYNALSLYFSSYY
jgi:hypothetical protein